MALSGGREDAYVTAKVLTTGYRHATNESKVYEHLHSIATDHLGATLIRKILNTLPSRAWTPCGANFKAWLSVGDRLEPYHHLLAPKSYGRDISQGG